MGPVTGKKVYVTCIWIGSMEWGFHGAGFFIWLLSSRIFVQAGVVSYKDTPCQTLAPLGVFQYNGHQPLAQPFTPIWFADK